MSSANGRPWSLLRRPPGSNLFALRKGIGPADKTGQEALLSNKLLKRVGEFIYGEQWQAPLSRDLGVNERSMRRWVAGTDEVPRGVWHDLGSRLETWHHALGRLVVEVKHTSGLVEVHSFKVWDGDAGEMAQPRAKSTASRIARIGGEIIPGTAEWVAPSNVDAEGRVREAMMVQAMKEQKTAQELADLIALRIGVGGVFVAVHKDPAYGWHPTVVTAPAAAHRCQLMAEEIALELRTKYDLKA
jgi:hypothetical protein